MRIEQTWRARGILCLACLAAWLCIDFGCGKKNNSRPETSHLPESSRSEDRLILMVGETPYYGSDFQNYVRETFGEGAENLEALTLSRLFDEFFETKLLLQAARRQAISVTPEEKDAYVDKIRRGTAEEMQELWEFDSGDLLEKLMIEKYLDRFIRDVRVEDEEIRRYYELHKSEYFLPERVQVSQILLPNEAEAMVIWEKVRSASEEEFRVAARTRSIGPEASRSGEMGVFQRGQLPLELETAIFSLAEGEVSPVIESSYGFHVFRLDQKFESEWIPLEEATDSIRRALLDLKIKQAILLHLRSLEERLEWQIYPENLFFPYQRNSK